MPPPPPPDRRALLAEIRVHFLKASIYRRQGERELTEARQKTWRYIETSYRDFAHISRILGVDESFVAGLRDGKRMLTPQFLEKLEKL